MRMLRWARGNTRLDNVRYVDIWKEALMNVPDGRIPQREEDVHMVCTCAKGRCQLGDKNISPISADGKRNRGRPKLRWRDLVKEDLARYQMTTEMAEDRKHWHITKCRGGKVRKVK